MKELKLLTLIFSVMLIFVSCNSNRSSATLGGSKDTADRIGGPQAKDQTLADTSLNGKSTVKGSKDSTAKGNANPTGHVKQ
jgi:hypothetical protein